MSEPEEEEIYRLEESFAKLGALPVALFFDQRGNCIDGVSRLPILKKLGIKTVELPISLGEVPKIVLPIKNPLQTHLLKMALNDWRRKVSPEERTRELIAMREAGWSTTQIAENTAYKYKTVLRYLPDKYKDQEKARAGRLGGQAGKKSEETSADTLSAPSLTETVLRRDVEENIESDEDSASRFCGLFKSHLNQLVVKDLPLLINFMSEEHDCGKCTMESACSLLLEFLTTIKNDLPACMKQKLMLSVAATNVP